VDGDCDTIQPSDEHLLSDGVQTACSIGQVVWMTLLFAGVAGWSCYYYHFMYRTVSVHTTQRCSLSLSLCVCVCHAVYLACLA